MSRLSIYNPWRIIPQEWDMDEIVPAFSDEPQMDVVEEGDNIVVTVKAAGFPKDSVDISIESNRLTIKGDVKKESEDGDKNKKYYKREIRQMSFTRSVDLPVAVKAEDAKAVFSNGILTVTLPKSEESKPKKISVNFQD